MKKKSLFMVTVTVFGLAAFLFSCTPTPIASPPVVNVSPSITTTARPGEKMNYEVTVSSDTDLKKVEMTGKIDNIVLFTADTVFPAGVRAAMVIFIAPIPVTVAAGSTIVVDFVVTNEGEMTTVPRNIQIIAGEIYSYTAVIMSDLENPEGSSFYSVEDNLLMSLNQAALSSGEVDLIYYYGATNKATLCSPADESVRAFTDSNGQIVVDRLLTKNNTKLALVGMTVADFNAITDEGPVMASKPATTFSATNNLVKDQVLYCQTVTGKQALILVRNITGTQATSYITIEVKVQK